MVDTATILAPLAPPHSQPPVRARTVDGTLALVATLAALGLLVALVLVARQAVRLGEERRRAAALMLEATWRCNTLARDWQRADCVLRYQRDRPSDSAGVQAIVAAAGTAVAVARW
jgi:short-subunit dehydrogenase